MIEVYEYGVSKTYLTIRVNAHGWNEPPENLVHRLKDLYDQPNEYWLWKGSSSAHGAGPLLYQADSYEHFQDKYPELFI